MLIMEHPREQGREFLKKTVPADLWNQNWQFCDELKKLIHSHKINRHPLIGVLNNEILNKEISKMIHLEFAYAFAQIFTDALIYAMAKSAELEPRLGPEAKVAARFLFQLNLLDELGFQPSEKISGDYFGNPELAHYCQFVSTVKSLGANPQDIYKFKPSASAMDSRQTFVAYFDNYVMLAGVLACAETVFSLFAGPWARSVSKSTQIDVSQGYHKIHVEDESGEFLDDYHSEDSWYLLAQALVPDKYKELRDNMNDWLDIWADFADNIVHLARNIDRK